MKAELSFSMGIGNLHSQAVYGRRVRVLSEHLSRLIPDHATVLDAGTGDGLIASLVQQLRPDTTITGVDVLERPTTYIPVTLFDGTRLPFAEKQFDVVTFVDVLHHTKNIPDLLREAARVARRALVIKDHLREGLLANSTLRLMDWVGNHRYGVSLPYNYWSRRQWREAFANLGLQEESWLESLHLYQGPLDLFFGRNLHFVARLSTSGILKR